MKQYKWLLVAVVICTAAVLSGCGMKMSDEKKGNIEYTVVTETDMPETLKKAIAERMKEPFKLSYVDKGELYIATGYGEQQTGGYSVIVNDMYMTDNTIVFETTLMGPDDPANVSGEVTYPYIVVKTEYSDYEVVFR